MTDLCQEKGVSLNCERTLTMNRCLMSRVLLLPVVLASVSGASHAQSKEPAEAERAPMPINRFVSLGEFTAGRRACTQVKPVWVEHLNHAVLWPLTWKEESKIYLTHSNGKPGAVRIKGVFKDNQFINRNKQSPLACCYLPKLKRVLYFQPRVRFQPKKAPTTWLLDPESGVWEAVAFHTRMARIDGAYDPGFGRSRQMAAPVYGNMVYDPVNGEAVLFGGSGVWGHVTRDAVGVKPGDWIFDTEQKQYLLLQPDTQIKKARRWLPSQCGTWTFSESSNVWTACQQPVIEQPPARILPAMTYIPDTKEILLFGGDNQASCLNDTWVYSCDRKTWSQLETPVAPSFRAAAALVYDPESKKVLLIGGYRAGWKPLADVWLFDPTTRGWSALKITIPGKKQGWISTCYDHGQKRILLSRVPSMHRTYDVELLSMRFDAAGAATRDVEPLAPGKAHHRPGWQVDDEQHRKSKPVELAALPANTWVDPKPAGYCPRRTWGQSTVYDVVTHRAIAWGGGHSTYAGLEYDTFDVLSNRWLLQNHPISYPPKWWHGGSNCPPGLTPSGINYVPGHSRRGYGVDPISGCVVTCGGDVFDIKTRRFIKKVRKSPFTDSGWGNPANVTTPHGLYMVGSMHSNGKGSSGVGRVNVRDAKWEVILKEGGPGHHEFDHLCYDSKRDRILHFGMKSRRIHAFDFKTKTWQRVEEKTKGPATYVGGSCYVPELDAVFLVMGTKDRAPDKIYVYKVEEGTWHTAPYKGVRMGRPNTHGLAHDVHYDPELRLFVYTGYLRGLSPLLMRPDFKALELSPLPAPNGQPGSAKK